MSVEIVRGIENWAAAEPAGSVALGYFDGVHRGHQRIIAAAVREARREGLKSIVLTFEPHPLAVLKPEAAPPLLTPFDEKARLVRALGVDVLLVLHFTPSLAQMQASSFVRDVLVGNLKVRHVTVGYNYTFGRGGEGTAEALITWGEELGFRVSVVPAVLVGGETVSSSRIRELLAAGELEKATAFLGRLPAVSGRVVHGARRGRSLGFPTANIEVAPGLALPRFGVYAVRAWYRCRPYTGVANIGYVPTFGPGPVRLEVHFFDFREDLYGRRLRIEFVSFLRPEKAFASATDLKAQMEVDAGRAREVLARVAATQGAAALFTTPQVCDRI